jgi:hypothetical protein
VRQVAQATQPKADRPAGAVVTATATITTIGVAGRARSGLVISDDDDDSAPGALSWKVAHFAQDDVADLMPEE